MLARIPVCACLGLVAKLSLLAAGAVAAPAPGDLLVAQTGTLFSIDPVTGDRTVLSGSGVGSGPLLDLPTQIAFDLDGSILVADFDLEALVRVDPDTGDRTIVASQTVGSGLPFRPTGVDVSVEAGILMTEGDGPSVVSVDPATGDRTVVSDAGTGSGTNLSAPVALRVRGQGPYVYVTDFDREAVVRVDWTSGDRTDHSSNAVGTGPLLDSPRGLGLAVGGDFFVADSTLLAIVRIDGTSGDRTVVSDAVTGTGPAFVFPYGVRSEADGNLVVTDFTDDTVLRVDPVTGDRTLVSGGATGSGPALVAPRAIAVVPISRQVTGFEADLAGFPPVGLPAGGNVLVESVLDAPEGLQVLTLSTGPGNNGGGPHLDFTGDGNVEHDRAEALFAIERGPTDGPLFRVDVAALTGESPTPGVGNADPLTLSLLTLSPPFDIEKSMHFANGTYTPLTGFAGGPRVGLDGSSYDEGQVGYDTVEILLDVGPHALFLRAADEIDALGDTAWRIDDLRFVPEPGGLAPFLAGGLCLLGLARRRSRGGRRSAPVRIRGILGSWACVSTSSSSTSRCRAFAGRVDRSRSLAAPSPSSPTSPARVGGSSRATS